MKQTLLSTDEVYLLLVAAIFSAYVFLLDLTFKKNKSLGFLNLLFPPMILVAIYKYWDDCKSTLIYLGSFITFLSLLGLFTGKGYISALWGHIVKLSLWQLHFFTWLYPKAQGLINSIG